MRVSILLLALVYQVSCEACGKPKFTLRELGNVPASTVQVPGSFPWTVLITSSNVRYCSGVIVDKRYILTSADCVLGKSASNLKIRVGEHDLRMGEGNEKEYAVAKTFINEKYNPRTYDFDIALIQLTADIEFNDFVKPICLPAKGSHETVGRTCFMTGWGDYNVLHQSRVPIVTRSHCKHNNYIANRVEVTMRQVCAGWGKFGVSSAITGCYGDRGSPLVCSNGGAWELAGVISVEALQCDSSKGPLPVYASGYSLSGWVQEVIAKLDV